MTYPFGETPSRVIELAINNQDLFHLVLEGDDAVLINTLLDNTTHTKLNKNLTKKELGTLLNCLKDVALENTNFWTAEEAERAYSVRCSILLELGIHEI